MGWVTPEDEVVSPLGGTGPDVTLLEAPHLRPFEVTHHHFLIDESPRFHRPVEEDKHRGIISVLLTLIQKSPSFLILQLLEFFVRIYLKKSTLSR